MLSITFKGNEELAQRLNRVILRLGSLEPAFTQVGRVLVDFFSTKPFLSEGSVYGTPWQPLSPSYKAYKERQYPGRLILQRSGVMQSSFVYKAEPMRVTISNTAEYFAKHQLGQGVPQRISMMLDREREKLVNDTISTEVKKLVEQAWEQ